MVGWISKLVLPDRSSKYRQTDQRKSPKKKLSDYRKSFQRLGEVYESQGLVCFLEHHDFDVPGSEDLINRLKNDFELRGPVGPEACQRTGPGYAHGR